MTKTGAHEEQDFAGVSMAASIVLKSIKSPSSYCFPRRQRFGPAARSLRHLALPSPRGTSILQPRLASLSFPPSGRAVFTGPSASSGYMCRDRLPLRTRELCEFARLSGSMLSGQLYTPIHYVYKLANQTQNTIRTPYGSSPGNLTGESSC